MNAESFRPRPQVKQRSEEAPMRMLASKHPAETTIEVVAAPAHCSQQTLYRYYDGKEELWLACTTRWLKG
jgi:AcrR family transcriptional regulator